MTAQRYDAMHKDVWTDESGKYVRYEDYAALKEKMDMINDLMSVAEQANALAKESVESLLKERDDARTELSSAMLTISQITDVVGPSETLSISQQVTELASRCSALAAESAGLNKFIDDECYVYGPHDVEPVDAALEKPETPATEAAIANIEARGVEKFAATMHADSTEQDALEYAAELRKEPRA